MTATTVLLAGGPRLFQAALAHALDGDEFDVVEVLDEAGDAEAMCERLRPAVAVVDASGGAARAIDACAAIKSGAAGTRVLLTSEVEDPELLVRGVRAGIDAFASREDRLPEILEALRTVARGEARIPPRMLGVLLRSLIERQREEERVMGLVSSLTEREREVLALLISGLNRDGIARNLFISPETARTHLQRILTKLGVHTQLEAVAMVTSCEAAMRHHGMRASA